jgi:hypothetical protein
VLAVAEELRVPLPAQGLCECEARSNFDRLFSANQVLLTVVLNTANRVTY